MIILHNKHDKESREFLAKYGQGNTIIDWYGDSKAQGAYTSSGDLPPSAFPCLVDKVEGVIVNTAKTPQDLIDAITEKKMYVGE